MYYSNYYNDAYCTRIEIFSKGFVFECIYTKKIFLRYTILYEYIIDRLFWNAITRRTQIILQQSFSSETLILLFDYNHSTWTVCRVVLPDYKIPVPLNIVSKIVLVLYRKLTSENINSRGLTEATFPIYWVSILAFATPHLLFKLIYMFTPMTY